MLISDKPTIDLGTIKFGQIYEFEYEITNTLGKDMIINKVQVSCSSCTKATMPRKIKGKQKAILKVTYTPGAVGNSNKWIDILYDGDQHLRITFKAVVNG